MQYHQGVPGRGSFVPSVIACAGAIVLLSSCSPARNSSPAARASVVSTSRPDRTIYPFSLVPGGVRDGSEVASVRLVDAVVKNHYSDIGTELTRETMPRDRWLYTSYRVGASVYWTNHTVRVRAGETVLSDGVHMIRGRCGNRLSAVPNKPTRLIDPPSILEDAPATLASDATPGAEDPVEIPVDLPGPPAIPGVSHPLPTVPIGPKPQAAIITGRTVIGPSATTLLEPRTSVATVEAPEPGTWAMMLGGLGMIGFAVRRSRKAARS